MSLDLKKTIDFEKLIRLIDVFHSATGIAVSIVNLDGKACVGTGHQKICSTFFHRHPDSIPICLQNEAQINNRLMNSESPVVHRCPHGLLNGAISIVADGVHVANLFTDKFLLAPPDADDIEAFKRLAARWRFNEKDFIEALLDIPIIPEDRITHILQYLKLLAEMIGETGQNRPRFNEGERPITDIRASLEKEIKKRGEDVSNLSQIIEASPIPTFVINMDAKVTHWNQACKNYTGIAATDAIGTGKHQMVCYPDKRPQMADLIVRQASTDEWRHYYGDDYRKSNIIEGGYDGEVFFPHLGRTGKWLFFTAAPIINGKGDVIGAIETIQDVTERRRAEHGLRISEARYHQLFESANDGIFVLKNGIVVDCNKKAAELFNEAREDIIGQAPVDFSPKIQPGGLASIDELAKKRELVSQGVRQFFDWRFFRKDGTSFDTEISMTQSVIDDAPHTLAIVRDITERKKIILNLQEREKELDEKSRYLEKVNQALKASLDHREIEKRAIEENMMVNLKRFVFPYLVKLGNCNINTDARAYLNIIETNLNDIVSRHSKTVLWKYQDLTPTEVQIADLIRSGNNTKSIAQMMGLSPSSIQWHRKNIRAKLGLTNKKINLQTYLTSLT